MPPLRALVITLAITQALAAASSSITASFPALLDDGTASPPDTTGAVGPHHIVTTLNSQIQVQTRSGAVLSTIQLEAFWAAAGPIRQFATDPHVVYDRAADRWVTCVLADPDGASALLVGVSNTGDPTGPWSLYRIVVDPNGRFAGDYPQIGLNGNWVVATLNVYVRETFDHSNIYVFSKSEFYAGGSATPHFTVFSDPNDSWFPVVDLDNVPNRFFLVEDYDGPNAKLAVSEIQGAVGSESFVPERGIVIAPSNWSDSSPPANGNFAPQLGTTAKIDTGDSRLLSCLLRNGGLWCSHTVFVPERSPTRSAAQWIDFDPSTYQLLQFGRLDDPSAVNFYAYPSLTVNKNNDMVLGFNRFSASQYPSADYAFRAGTDAPNTIGPDTVIKPGESFYRGSGSSGNRWGDFSTTVIDPTDDLTFWTIQEYGASPAAKGTARWGTWWASIASQPAAAAVPAIAPAGVLNAAGGKGFAIAPGEILTIVGANLGPAALQSASGTYGPLLAGTRVLFDGIPGPVIYASAKQTAAVAPFTLATAGSTQVQVEYLGVASGPVVTPLAPAAIAVFTADQSGSGQGSILNEDGSVNSTANPAPANSAISIFATGAGQTNPPSADGQLAQAPLPSLLQRVAVQIGGAAAQVQYAGPAPGLLNGVVQINAQIPAGVSGVAVVIVTVGGVSSPPVTVAVGR